MSIERDFIVSWPSVEEINGMPLEALHREFARLLSLDGGTMDVTKDPIEYTLFTCVTQHVSACDFATLVKKALVQEHRRHNNLVMSYGERATWYAKHGVPAHLQ